MSRTAAIVLRQYYLLRGNLSRALSPVVWVTIDIVLWGFITKYLNAVTSSGFNPTATITAVALRAVKHLIAERRNQKVAT